MDIHPVDPRDDMTLRALYDLQRRALLEGREDMPFWSWREMKGAMREQELDERRQLFGGYVDGRLVGAAGLFVPLLDNLDKAWVLADVDPDHQHQGLGRALLAHAEAAARDAGRTTLLAETKLPFDTLTSHRHRRFLEAAGYTLANVEIVRLLDLPVDDADLDAWEAEAAERHEGYEITTYVDEVPEHLLPGLSRLMGQLVVDAPTGEVEWEEEVRDPQDLATRRAELVAAGRTLYETVATAPDGTVAAQTTLSVPPPGRADVSQWGTFVHREHRGRRLGLAVKTANLRAVQRAHPEMRRVLTQNAETNDWMVAINVRMGFEPEEASAEFVKRV